MFQDDNRVEGTLVYELFKMVFNRREFTIIDPKSFARILSVLGQHHDLVFEAELSKLVALLLDMQLAFIKSERNIIATALSAEDFYGVVADVNLLVAESGMGRTLKRKLLAIAEVHASIYEYQVKKRSTRFVEGAAANVAEYFATERAELKQLVEEWNAPRR